MYAQSEHGFFRSPQARPNANPKICGQIDVDKSKHLLNITNFAHAPARLAAAAASAWPPSERQPKLLIYRAHKWASDVWATWLASR